MDNLVIIRTSGGRKFARRIAHEFKSIGGNIALLPSVNYFPETFRRRRYLIPSNTIIHPRAAHPRARWMNSLKNLERNEYLCVNSTKVLELTSDKLKCSEVLYNAGLPYPKTIRWPRNKNLQDIWRENFPNQEVLVSKPITSISQGRYVNKLTYPTSPTYPASPLILQEYVPYRRIFRVIVLGGRALNFSFKDEPTHESWKVSVCLNPRMKFVPYPERDLLLLAEKVQQLIGGEINFIDIFETDNGYILSEVNTACNLSLHEKKSYHNIAREIARYLLYKER